MGFASFELIILLGLIIGVCLATLMAAWIFGLPLAAAGPLGILGIGFVVLALKILDVLGRQGNRPFAEKRATGRQPSYRFSPAKEQIPPPGPIFKGPIGLNFRTNSDLTMEQLTGILVGIVGFFERYDPNARLMRYDDWWVHDGIHYLNGETDYPTIYKLIKDEQSIQAAMQDEVGTCVGIAPESVEWYLRFAADLDEDTDVMEGYFDVTIPDKLVEKFRKEILPGLPCEIIEEAAQAYYDRLRH